MIPVDEIDGSKYLGTLQDVGKLPESSSSRYFIYRVPTEEFSADLIVATNVFGQTFTLIEGDGDQPSKGIIRSVLALPKTFGDASNPSLILRKKLPDHDHPTNSSTGGTDASWLLHPTSGSRHTLESLLQPEHPILKFVASSSSHLSSQDPSAYVLEDVLVVQPSAGLRRTANEGGGTSYSEVYSQWRFGCTTDDLKDSSKSRPSASGSEGAGDTTTKIEGVPGVSESLETCTCSRDVGAQGGKEHPTALRCRKPSWLDKSIYGAEGQSWFEIAGGSWAAGHQLYSAIGAVLTTKRAPRNDVDDLPADAKTGPEGPSV